jgi:hypothetical protein
MKKRILTYIALFWLLVPQSCVTETYEISLKKYEWVATKIFSDEGNLLETITPPNNENGYQILFDGWFPNGILMIYKDGDLLLQCDVIDGYSATDNETNCMHQSSCSVTSCGLVLCRGSDVPQEGPTDLRVHGFPYIDDRPVEACRVISYFKRVVNE